MFDKPFVERLRHWRDLRQSIEQSNDPIKDVLNFWNKAPICRLSTDPYDKDTWPDPWEMLEENQYCDFTKILAIYYTFQLTELFSQSRFEIHITLNEEESKMLYLLFVDNQAIGYYNDRCIDRHELPTLTSQMQHILLPTY